MGKKKYTGRAFWGFLLFALLCTFLSKSIYNYSIPEVTAALPTEGRLDVKVEGTAYIDYADVHTVYSESDGRIQRILAKAGDTVKKGWTVMVLADTAGRTVKIKAGWTGVITKIGVKEGMYVSFRQNTELCEIAEQSGRWQAALWTDDEERGLLDEESVPILQINGMHAPVTGRIQSIAAGAGPDGSGWQVGIEFEARDVNLAGRQAAVTVTCRQETYDTLVPAAALQKDASGYYVLILQENDSVLGSGYAAARRSVELLDSDGVYCAVRGLPQDEAVITAGADEIADGSGVYVQEPVS